MSALRGDHASAFEVEQLAGLCRQIATLTARLEVAEADNADLKSSVVAFGVLWAPRYGYDHYGSAAVLHPDHYDLLARCGGRMDDFRRAALTPPATETP
jgi:hypothetical protein